MEAGSGGSGAGGGDAGGAGAGGGVPISLTRDVFETRGVRFRVIGTGLPVTWRLRV